MSSWKELVSRFSDEIKHLTTDNDKEIFEQHLFDQIMASNNVEEIGIKRNQGPLEFLKGDGSFQMLDGDLEWIDSKTLDVGLHDQVLKCMAKETIYYLEEEVLCYLFSKSKKQDEKTQGIKRLIEEAQMLRWQGDYDSYYDIIMTLEEMGVSKDQFYRYLEK